MSLVSALRPVAYLTSLAAVMTGTAGAADGPAAIKQVVSGKASNPQDRASVVLQKRPDFVLWDGDKKITPPMPGLIYHIERADRDRLLLAVPSEGLRGWALARTVIPMSQAESFFSYVIRIQSGDPFAYLMRGIVRTQTDDLDHASADLDAALRRDPKYVAAWIQRAFLWQVRNRLDLALADVNRAIELDPANPEAFVVRGVLHFARKEFDQSRKDLDGASAMGSRAVVIPITRGMLDLETKDTKKAHDEFVHALQIDPKRHDAYLGLASVYLIRGQPRAAQAVLDDSVHADPNNPEGYGNRAVLYLTRGNYEQALCNWNEVVRLAPTSPRAFQERAWLLATCPVAEYRDGTRAVASATRACELTHWKEPHYLATLAAAYAETGDFDNAVQCQEKAISLLGWHGAGGVEFRKALDRYKAKKPHHPVGLLEEVGIRSYHPVAKPGDRPPG